MISSSQSPNISKSGGQGGVKSNGLSQAFWERLIRGLKMELSWYAPKDLT